MSQSFYPFDSASAIESFDVDEAKNYFFHEASNRHYEMSIKDGAMFITRYRQREDGSRFAQRRQRVDYVMGSGNHVRSYLYRCSPAKDRDQNERHVAASTELFELPIVWYTQSKTWGMAPGFDHADHEGFDRPVTRQCMFCHNAYPDFQPDAAALGTAASETVAFGTVHRFPNELPHGIGCQRCHGPGSAHVQRASDDASLAEIVGTIVNPTDLSIALAEDVCLQCHLQPTSRRSSIVQAFGSHDYAFQPGQALGDHLVHLELDERTSETNRFDINHHPYRLHQSACYQESKESLSCTTCHDPHVNVPVASRAAHYRKRCLTCHQTDDCLDVEQGRGPKADCVSCHMPNRRTEDVVHVVMTDHKIVRRVTIAEPTASLEESSLSIELSLRGYDRRLASQGGESPATSLYPLIAGSRDLNPAAIRKLQIAMRNDPPDAIEPWLQLGQSQVEIGSYAESVTTLQRALAMDPDNAMALANLGIARLKLGQFEDAVQHLLRSSAREGARPETWFNLGLAYVKLGDDEAARHAYENALQLRPNYARARFSLGNVLARGKDFAAAKMQFERAIELDPDDVNSYGNLSAVHRALEDNSSAKRVLSDGLISVPGNAALTRALDALNEDNDDQEANEAKD